MTSLNCWNSGVESKDRAFIHLPKRACACHAPASSWLSSGTHLSLVLRFAGQFIISQPSSDNLSHNDCETLSIGQLTIVKTKALLIGIRLQVERFHAHVGALQGAFKQAPEVLQTVRMNVVANIRLCVVD